MASTKKTVIVRSTKQELYDLLVANVPGLFGSKTGLTFPTDFDIESDPLDSSNIQIVFNEETEPSP